MIYVCVCVWVIVDKKKGVGYKIKKIIFPLYFFGLSLVPLPVAVVVVVTLALLTPWVERNGEPPELVLLTDTQAEEAQTLVAPRAARPDRIFIGAVVTERLLAALALGHLLHVHALLAPSIPAPGAPLQGLLLPAPVGIGIVRRGAAGTAAIHDVAVLRIVTVAVVLISLRLMADDTYPLFCFTLAHSLLGQLFVVG